MLKAAIYCRLSAEDRNKTGKEDDSESIRNQKAILLRYAQANGWQVYDIYCDEDYSGADRTRPDFCRLIADARQRRFDIVLCKTQSRFTRELELAETYIHGLFPKLGIRFISIADDVDSEDHSNRKARQISALANEWLLEELSDNVKAVLALRRSEGLFTGSAAPYGYQKDPNRKGHLIIDPDAAEVVRMIFSLCLQGYGKRSIARILNSKEIPNPTQYRNSAGKGSKNCGTFWSAFTVGHILNNEVYIGNMVQGKTTTESYNKPERNQIPCDQWVRVMSTHAPIIDMETWERVQLITPSGAMSANNEQKGAFAGKLRCALCGSIMYSTKNGRKRGFSCGLHARHRDACVGVSISLAKVEHIVGTQLESFSRELLDTVALSQCVAVFPAMTAQQAELERQVCILENQLSHVKECRMPLYLSRIRGNVSEEEYAAMNRRLSDEIDTYTHRIDEKNAEINRIRAMLVSIDKSAYLTEHYLGPGLLRSEVVSALIGEIRIGRQEDCRSIEIHWNF